MRLRRTTSAQGARARQGTRKGWRRFLSPRWRFGATVFVAVAFFVTHELALWPSWLRNAETEVEDIVDPLVRLSSHIGWVRASVPIVFIEIDQATYLSWKDGKPLRERLMQLVAAVANSGAGVILVDFTLSQPSDGDEALREYLRAYSGSPPIVLVGDYRVPQNGVGVTSTAGPFDEVVEVNPKVFLASALLSPSTDSVVRRARLWEADCTGSPAPIPSAPVLALLLQNNPDSGALGLQRQLQEAADSICNGDDQSSVLVHFGNDSARTLLLPSDSDPRSRLFYSFRWSNLSEIPMRQRSSNQQIEDGIIPANHIKITASNFMQTAETGLNPLGALSRDRPIVVIGATYYESSDIYSTPSGRMPGAFILANITTWLDRVSSHSYFNSSITTIIKAILFSVFVLLIKYFRPFVAIFFASALFLVTEYIAARWGFADAMYLLFDSLIVAFSFEIVTVLFLVLLPDCLEHGFIRAIRSPEIPRRRAKTRQKRGIGLREVVNTVRSLARPRSSTSSSR